MRSMRVATWLAVFALLVFALAACGGAPAGDEGGDDHVAEDDHDGDHGNEYAFGAPGHAEDAVRVIEVDALDDFTFAPSVITVSAGETVTFVVTNVGAIPHDFTLGDDATQAAHDAEMAEMAEGGMMSHDDPNAVVIQPGETEELTWTFTDAGTVLIGCHQPGHYAAGMKGSVEVQA